MKKALPSLAAALLATLLLAGCGPKSDDSSGGASAPSVSKPATGTTAATSASPKITD